MTATNPTLKHCVRQKNKSNAIQCEKQQEYKEGDLRNWQDCGTTQQVRHKMMNLIFTCFPNETYSNSSYKVS